MKTAKAEPSECGSSRRGTPEDPRPVLGRGRWSGNRWSGGLPPTATAWRLVAGRNRRVLSESAWFAAGRAGEPVTRCDATVHGIVREWPAPRCSPGRCDGSPDPRRVFRPRTEEGGWRWESRPWWSRQPEPASSGRWKGCETPWREANDRSSLWPVHRAPQIARGGRITVQSPSRRKAVGLSGSR